MTVTMIVMMTMCLKRIYGHHIVRIIKTMCGDFFLQNTQESEFKLGETVMLFFFFVASIQFLLMWSFFFFGQVSVKAEGLRLWEMFSHWWKISAGLSFF